MQCGNSSDDVKVVHALIIEQLGALSEDIVPGARFIEDLNADSLDCIELLMAVEEEFAFEMPDEDAERILTVGQLVEYLQTHGYVRSDAPEEESDGDNVDSGDPDKVGG